MIYNPRIHKSKLPHPKSGDHKRYFIYKQGKCYLEGACYEQVRIFVQQRRDALGIPKDVILKQGNVLGILKDAGYYFECVTAKYDKIYQEWIDEEERVKRLYKTDLKHAMFSLDCSDETFDKFYDIADALCDLEPIDFHYEESMHIDKHEELEDNLKELAQVAFSFRKDLRQK